MGGLQGLADALGEIDSLLPGQAPAATDQGGERFPLHKLGSEVSLLPLDLAAEALRRAGVRELLEQVHFVGELSAESIVGGKGDREDLQRDLPPLLQLHG